MRFVHTFNVNSSWRTTISPIYTFNPQMRSRIWKLLNVSKDQTFPSKFLNKIIICVKFFYTVFSKIEYYKFFQKVHQKSYRNLLKKHHKLRHKFPYVFFFFNPSNGSLIFHRKKTSNRLSVDCFLIFYHHFFTKSQKTLLV